MSSAQTRLAGYEADIKTPGSSETPARNLLKKPVPGALRNQSPLLAKPCGQPVCAATQPLTVCRAGTGGRPAAGRILCKDPAVGGQVASAQAPSRRARPFPSRLRRLTAAVRRLSQAWFLATPR